MQVGDLVQELGAGVEGIALVIRCLHRAESPHHTHWLVQFLDGTRDTLRESFLEVVSG